MLTRPAVQPSAPAQTGRATSRRAILRPASPDRRPALVRRWQCNISRFAIRPSRVTTAANAKTASSSALVLFSPAANAASSARGSRYPCIDRDRVRIRTRRRQERDDRGERIGPFVGGEPHHAQHDDDADHRRRRRRRGRRRRGACRRTSPRTRENSDASSSAFRRLTTVAVKAAASSCDSVSRAGRDRLQRRADHAQVGERGARSASHHSRCALTAICSATASSPS